MNHNDTRRQANVLAAGFFSAGMSLAVLVGYFAVQWGAL